VSGITVFDLVREVQIPLLAALLIGGCAAKGSRAISLRSIEAGTGPTAIFPLRLRRPVAIAMCATELALGFGLLVTAGHFGAGRLALTVRVAAALLFCTAAGALHELRARRPSAGCGCFGDLSDTPVNWRTITRAALLGLAALSCIGVPPLHMPGSSGQAAAVVMVTAVELLAALSPEVGEVLIRLGHAEPCELRRVPVARTLAGLQASAPWRRYRPCLTAVTPSDMWREGCWHFVVFPGEITGRRVDVIFAVYLAGRHAPVRVGVLDVDAPPPRHARLPGPLQISNHVLEKRKT
jgi:hypothetical protein